MEGISLFLLLASIKTISDGQAWFAEQVTGTLKLLSQEVPVQVILENDCSLCKPVAETAIGLALTNKLVSAEIVVADDYPELLSKLKVKVLPYTLFGPKLHLEGHVSESMFLEMLFQAEGQKAGSDKRCVVCGQPSPDMICNSCKTRIQAEAVNHKRRDEKLHEAGTIVEPHAHG